MMRIGAVSYLNTRPLIHGLTERLPQARLELDLPSRLADRLRCGELDVALIPSVEYFRGSGRGRGRGCGHDWTIISDACIACRGPVRSVRLLFRDEPSRVQSIALDEGSRTSAALARILLASQYDLTPTILQLPIGHNFREVDADAILLIGDRAMYVDETSWHTVWDLGDQWYRLTGLPFVFAMWVGRMRTGMEEVASVLRACRDEGLRNARAIAAMEAPQYGLQVEDCLRYFTSQLYFFLGPSELAGLELFHRWATELELIPGDVVAPSLTNSQ